ncbi:MAG: efflux RND transporter permease subunit [Gammaproteobacteria bacterium AqS3]|nr:efflux RND transporter permease subunit [Gammaproteobacteria bacterium AqS3]
MLGVIDMVMRRARAMFVLMIGILLTGIVSYSYLPVAAEPEIDVPFVSVFVRLDGADPRDVERLITRPIEQELNSLKDLTEMTSYSRLGSMRLILEFDVNLDSEVALDRTRAAMDNVRARLPSEADQPMIEALAVNEEPAIVVSLASHTVPLRQIYREARNLKRDLENLPDVLRVDIRGERERVMEVVISPERLESVGLTATELYQVIRNNNRLITAGRLNSETGAFSVSVPSVIENAVDVYNLPLKSDRDGGTLVLGDVAEVRDTFKDAATYTRINGRPTVSLEVIRRDGAFLIELVDEVRTYVEGWQEEANEAIEIIYSQDSAPWAKGLVSALQGNILTAVLLVMTVVVMALGLRSSLLVGIGVPFSFMVSFIFLYQIGYSFNFMVMFGMLLAMGMLIDGSVVVVEYADRKMAEGADPATAYRTAAKRMFWPVTASVFTTLAAFLPLVLWPDISGKFMRYLPVTVFGVLLASLMYALIFLPVLGAYFARPNRHVDIDQVSRLEYAHPSELSGATGLYARGLFKLMRHPVLTLMTGIFLLMLIYQIYGHHNHGVKFFTETEPKYLITEVRARGNISTEEKRDLIIQAEREITQLDEIETAYTAVGARWRGSPPDTIGLIYIALKDYDQRTRPGKEALRDINERTSDIPGVIVSTREMEQGPPVGRPIQIELLSDYSEALEVEARKVMEMLRQIPDITEVDSTLPLPQIEWKLQLDKPRADALGVNLAEAGAMLQLVTNGILVDKYRPDGHDDEVDIRVRYDDAERSLTQIDSLRLASRNGPVPLSSIAQLKPVQGVSTIYHVDGVGRHVVNADLAPGVLPASKMEAIRSWLADPASDIDPRVKIKLRGSDEKESEAGLFLAGAGLLALCLMLVMLVIQFNRVYQAILILSAIVMSTAGVLIGLLVSGRPFSIIMTGVGIVALAGIVVNNNIVLIDTYNHLRRQYPNVPHDELVVRTSVLRLRPVLLTTTTTILGLLPISLHLSFDFISGSIVYGGETTAWWVQMANAIVWGLGFSTLLTLVMTPAALHLPAAIKTAWRARSIFRSRSVAPGRASKSAEASPGA